MKYVVTVNHEMKEFNNIILATIYLHNELIKHSAISGTIHSEDEIGTIAICYMKTVNGIIQVNI